MFLYTTKVYNFVIIIFIGLILSEDIISHDVCVRYLINT